MWLRRHKEDSDSQSVFQTSERHQASISNCWIGERSAAVCRDISAENRRSFDQPTLEGVIRPSWWSAGIFQASTVVANATGSHLVVAYTTKVLMWLTKKEIVLWSCKGQCNMENSDSDYATFTTSWHWEVLKFLSSRPGRQGSGTRSHCPLAFPPQW